ncbi:MAG: nucleotidyltransferase domain-containing protein [Leptolyngbyaceae cyanobacterium]
METSKKVDINTSSILSSLKNELIAFYKNRFSQLILFGSQARGEANSDSDIDVLVVLKPPVNAGAEIRHTSQIIADLSLQYDVVLSCLFMDENHYSTRNSPLLRNIRREGILL